MIELILAVIGLIAGAALMWALTRLGGGARSKRPLEIRTDLVAERIRTVGKLVGLEVHAKEIATTTRGVSWLPPILLSQAKLAMIFHFEKQYFADLSRLNAGDVREVSPGVFRVALPAVEGALRLTDVWPYDIQAGRVLGLIDVIQMNAQTQKELMRAAQDQAAELFTKSEPKYAEEAKRSIERHLESLSRLMGASIEVEWRANATPGTPAHPGALPMPGEPIELAAKLRRQLALAGA